MKSANGINALIVTMVVSRFFDPTIRLHVYLLKKIYICISGKRGDRKKTSNPMRGRASNDIKYLRLDGLKSATTSETLLEDV